MTFEGIDGAGKSTCLEYARNYLEERGRHVVITREPGGTTAGEEIRNILLDRRLEWSAEAECLLVFAARHEHVGTVIRPALDAGAWVLCDRFLDATYAYQVGGRQLERCRVDYLADWLIGPLSPDLTILVDAPLEVAQARLKARGGEGDRFEAEESAFHERVRAMYQQLARSAPARIRAVPAELGRTEMSDWVKRALDEFL